MTLLHLKELVILGMNTKYEKYLILIPINSQKKFYFRKSCNIHVDIPNNMTKIESVQYLRQSGELVDT